MTHPAISQIEAYWEALRGDRIVPLRAEVDPRGIDRALEYAFILERIAPNVARFRLAGMHLNDLMGMEVRGMPVTTFLTPDARNRFRETLEHVFEQPARARLRLAGEGGFGRPQLRGQMVLMPLRSDLGDISRALGCLVTEGSLGRTPHRFTLSGVQVSPLGADGSPAEMGPVATPFEAQGFQEPSTPFGGSSKTAAANPRRARSHLRLVHDADKSG